MNKERYIDLMERVFDAYSDERIRDYNETAMKNGIEEHGYPRLTANLGILIAHGKKVEYKDEFRRMMDLCCREIPTIKEKNGGRVGNDFSVKEIVWCLLEVEKAGVFDKSITDGWRKDLSNIDPYQTYTIIAPIPPEPVNNWAAFGAASEQLRKYAGIGNESGFIENQIASQLLSLDENGMYRDPGEPMVYDSVTRLQLAIALRFGFDGSCKDALLEELLKSADYTIYMQSVTGEIPYGGRSAQFLHNEAQYAAICEFYAALFKKTGDIIKAGQFKSAACRAIENIVPWLESEKVYHIKNYYDNDSMYGCEYYAYFDKYMISAGSMLYAAYILADDDIEEKECLQRYICETSEHFHKVVCRYYDYFVEIDTQADTDYDANGIGRVHMRGIPSALCLSVPFPEKPDYGIDIENPSLFSICAGIKKENGYRDAFEESTKYNLVEKIVDEKFVRVMFECCIDDGIEVFLVCTLSDDGVEISATGEGEVRILFPLFSFDGKKETEISLSGKKATVLYRGKQCSYRATEKIIDLDKIYANRNGHYRAMMVAGENSVSLKIKMW